MILEQRDYHVTTGKLIELVALYDDGGYRDPAGAPRRVRRRLHDRRRRLSTYTSLWRYDSYAEREQRRAALQADPRDGWSSSRKIQPLIHTQQNRILVPTSFSPLQMRRLEGKVAIVTGGAQGIGARSPAGSLRKARGS